MKREGERKIPVEKELIRKDGARILVLVAGAMLDEARFDGVGFVLDCRTQADGGYATGERRKSSSKVVRNRTYYATAPIGLAVFDTNTRYLRINELLAESNGMPLRITLDEQYGNITRNGRGDRRHLPSDSGVR